MKDYLQQHKSFRQRIEEKAQLIRDKRKPYRTSWGFLVRPSYQEVFKFTPKPKEDPSIVKVTGEELLKEFNKWHRKSTPLGAKCYRQRIVSFVESFWAFPYSGHYYVTIKEAPSAGTYPVTLFYRNDKRESYPIAVAHIKLENFYRKAEILPKLPLQKYQATDEMLANLIPK